MLAGAVPAKDTDSAEKKMTKEEERSPVGWMMGRGIRRLT